MHAVIEDSTRHGSSPCPCEIGYCTESVHRRHGAPGDAGFAQRRWTRGVDHVL